MMTVIAFMAAIITVETALTDGTKSVEKMKVPEKEGVVRFVWPKEKVPACCASGRRGSLRRVP